MIFTAHCDLSAKLVVVFPLGWAAGDGAEDLCNPTEKLLKNMCVCIYIYNHIYSENTPESKEQELCTQEAVTCPARAPCGQYFLTTHTASACLVSAPEPPDPSVCPHPGKWSLELSCPWGPQDQM